MDDVHRRVCMVVTWTWPRSTPGESRERAAHHIEAKEDGEIKDEEEEKLRMSTELKKMKGEKSCGLRIAYTAPLNTIILKTICVCILFRIYICIQRLIPYIFI
ncbi:hypothetical protein PV325_008072 [Microctonus aethiopoides]|nr:hypothetical protein PV325_008072 [Microctonus aethiopoides]